MSSKKQEKTDPEERKACEEALASLNAVEPDTIMEPLDMEPAENTTAHDENDDGDAKPGQNVTTTNDDTTQSNSSEDDANAVEITDAGEDVGADDTLGDAKHEGVSDSVDTDTDTDAEPDSAPVPTASEKPANGTQNSTDAQAPTDAKADETISLDDLPKDQSLTRELPVLGSTPAVEQTVAIGDLPLPSIPSAQEAESRNRHMSPRRKRVVATVVVVAAIAAGAAGYAAWNTYQQQEIREEKADAHTMMSVHIGIHAPGLDSSSGTKIPIDIDGEDTDGASVSLTAYVDQNGNGIKLMPGTYRLSVAASPIAADGTIYTVPADTVEITVKEDALDLSKTASFKFKVPSSDTVTEQQISLAAKYAEKGGCRSAAVARILEHAATSRMEAATRATAQRKTQVATEANERHKATNAYQLDIPLAWYGKVATWQNGNTMGIYALSGSNQEICRLDVLRNGETYQGDDTVLGTVSLGNGASVVVHGKVLPYQIAQTINGRTEKADDTYSMDEAVELVELVTGNRYAYDQIKHDLVGKDGKSDKATKLEKDYLAQTLLPSIKAEN